MPKVFGAFWNWLRDYFGPVRPIILLGLPMLITGYSSVLMQFTDAWMVGQLGSKELAAVTPAGLLVSLVVTFGAECLTAVNSFVSTVMGRKRFLEAGRYTWQGIYLSLILGVGALVYWPTASTVFKTMFPNLEQDVIDLQVVYFQISLLAILPQLVSVTLSNFFIGCHMPILPMVVALCSVVANAALNYALIFGWGPFPRLGFEGSAWGTVFASCFQMVLMMALFFLKPGVRKYGVTKWGISKGRIKRMLAVGIPSGVHGCLDLLSWGVMLAWLIGHFGGTHLAAQTILVACIRCSFLPADSIASALTTLVGNAQGERNFLLAKRLAKAAFRLIALYMTTMAVIFYVGRYWIMESFTMDKDVIAVGAQCMIFVAAFQYFDAMNVTYINALQGAGDTAWPTAVQLILTVVVLIGGGLLVIHRWPELKSAGVWAVAALYVFSQGILFRFRWTAGGWRRIKLLGS